MTASNTSPNPPAAAVPTVGERPKIHVSLYNSPSLSSHKSLSRNSSRAALPSLFNHSSSGKAPPEVDAKNDPDKENGSNRGKGDASKSQLSYSFRLMKSLSVELGLSGRGVPTNSDVCPICLLTYRTGEEMGSLPCHHGFHKQCIDAWFVCHATCPICRKGCD